MASLRTCTANKRGFTLIEMLIVIGLIVALGSVVLFFDINTYRGDAFRAERTMVVTLLQQARASAMNNIAEEPHGLALFPADNPHNYVLFEGTSYTASNPATRQAFEPSYAVTLGGGSPTEVVFEQLSGNASYTGAIKLEDPNRNTSFDIAINHEGAISW